MDRIALRALARTAGVLLSLSLTLLGGGAPVAVAATCLPTGAVDRDGTALTARVVNPSGVVRGRVDATGCEVGVYFSQGTGRVEGADIFGARYYGVLADGNGHTVSVDVRNSAVHEIGEPQLSASRHGQGIAYRAFGGSASGTAAGNQVWHYQEAGINLTGPGTTAIVSGNHITGRGAQGVISQNGVQVIHGAHGTVAANHIADLRYLGPNVGNGVLVVGGPGYGFPYTRDATISGNAITNADVGINVFEIEEDDSPAPEPTRIVITRNLIRNDGLTNLMGWDDETGFQAGIADYANGDVIVGNVVLGPGYDQDACGSAAICSGILTLDSINPTVSGNILR
jgi:hypothetical protein